MDHPRISQVRRMHLSTNERSEAESVTWGESMDSADKDFSLAFGGKMSAGLSE